MVVSAQRKQQQQQKTQLKTSNNTIDKLIVIDTVIHDFLYSIYSISQIYHKFFSSLACNLLLSSDKCTIFEGSLNYKTFHRNTVRLEKNLSCCSFPLAVVLALTRSIIAHFSAYFLFQS